MRTTLILERFSVTDE